MLTERTILKKNKRDMDQCLFCDDAVPKPPNGEEEPVFEGAAGRMADVMEDTPPLEDHRGFLDFDISDVDMQEKAPIADVTFEAPDLGGLTNGR